MILPFYLSCIRLNKSKVFIKKHNSNDVMINKYRCLLVCWSYYLDIPVIEQRSRKVGAEPEYWLIIPWE